MKVKNLMILVASLTAHYCFTIEYNNQVGLLDQYNKAIGQAYYAAMAEKDIDDVGQYLDENVLFTAPLTTIIGKQEFIERVKEFFIYSGALKIRATFGSQDQAMVVFTSDYPGAIGSVDFAALLDIKDGLITKIELFYDARLFEKQ